MSVADLLGLDDDDNPLLQAARERWPEWAAKEPRLAAVKGLDHLLAWRREVDQDTVDQLLVGLAMLAATDGGNDEAAAAALAKVMLPAVCRIGGRLASGPLSELFRDSRPVDSAMWCRRLDEVLAAQLWIEVRSFPWRTHTAVTGIVKTRVRNGVLREIGEPYRAGRGNTTWARTSLLGTFHHDGDPNLEPSSEHEQRGGVGAWTLQPALLNCGPGLLADPSPAPDEMPQTPAEELLEVLEWACDEHVITTEDRRLLMLLVQEAEHVPIRNNTRGRGGLLSNEVSARVARRVGVSPQTVRRRGTRTLTALATAATEFVA